MSKPILPENEAVLAIWRVGLIAYRDASRRMLPVNKCHDAGIAAILTAYPHMTKEEASKHSIESVAWAAGKHHAWLYNGVPRREWIWPPDRRGVGRHRNPGYEDA